jgi:hypothetical protein
MILCCPSCRSTEIYAIAGGYIGQVYRCKECGYRGSFVLEISEGDQDLTKDRESDCPGND